MKGMMFLSMILSCLFSMVKNPMMMVILIITQSLIVCLMLFIKLVTSWYSYILFLIFMGGLMVLFIYICSVASNENVNNKMEYKLLFLLVGLLMFLTAAQEKMMEEVTINKIYFIFSMMMEMNMYLVLMTMFFLLFTLVVVVKISENKMGPIRSIKKM